MRITNKPLVRLRDCVTVGVKRLGVTLAYSLDATISARVAITR
jgi:hypothetical protein